MVSSEMYEEMGAIGCGKQLKNQISGPTNKSGERNRGLGAEDPAKEKNFGATLVRYFFWGDKPSKKKKTDALESGYDYPESSLPRSNI